TYTPTNTFTITNTPTATNTFTSTFTPVPPTATPTAQTGLNINFSQWYLQEPSGSGTSPTTRANSWLEDGNSDTYFYTAKDGWKAYVDVNPGITTSGSEHPRCEMHEESTWGTGGTNTMTITGKITQIDGDTTTIGQIFNNNEGTLIEMQYSKSAGQFKVFYEEVKGSGGYPTQTYVSWPMNTTYTYKLSLTGGVAQVTINGQVVFTHTLSSSVSGDQFYFKAGNYDQSATGTTVSGDVSTTPYSIVEIGSAVIVHQ
ncbi:MAG TPA: polysaccharide lyase family 7 protein, partial [bacterium]|nr:polysaccharide lyase family 7 protein [bacterium]